MTDKNLARRAWDSYDVYLFDIDGTLLNCEDAVHYFAFCAALETISGRQLNLNGVKTHGNTDMGILRDALNLAEIPEEQWRPRIADIQIAMCRFVEERKHEMRITVLPGVNRILDHLQSRGAILGVATGNFTGIGELKLTLSRLVKRFHFAGYSDGYDFRRDVFKAAAQNARALAGQGACICVVGDTPEDILAGRANELDVIAVATGIFPFDELEDEKPDWCLHTLDELLDPKME